MLCCSRKFNKISLLGFEDPLRLIKRIEASYLYQQKNLRLELLCLNLRCYKKDEYCSSDIEGTENNLYSSPVYSCKFGKTDDTNNLLALAFEDGRIVIQNIKEDSNTSLLSRSNAHLNAIFELSWSHKKREIISASADTTLRLWSLQPDANLTLQHTFKGHQKSVKTVDTSKWDPDIFASSGRDCCILLWDTRCQPHHRSNEISGAHSNTNSKSFSSPHISHSNSSQVQNSIISVLFCQQHNLISAGASDGLIKLWDLRKTYSIGKRGPQSIHTLEYVGNSSCRGFTSMCLSPYSERVYVTCLDGKIYAYHLVNPTYEPVAEYYGHRPKTYYTKACLSPCGSFLLSGSSDDSAYIWNTSVPGSPICSLVGHLDEVTCVDWSPRNDGMVVTCSDDKYHRIFHLKKDDDSQINAHLRCYSKPYKLKCPSQCELTKNSIQQKDSELNIINNIETTPNRLDNKTQKTPRTSERKLLISWLSGSKTPDDRSIHRPSSKGTSKRKLTDIIEGNEENLMNENKRKSSIPTKLALRPTDCNLLNTPPSAQSKMLSHQTSFREGRKKESLEVIHEECESFTIDVTRESYINENASVFRNRFTSHDVTPVKSSTQPSTSLTSPTANLPNFVIDGSSPHSRSEAPVLLKRRSDWLTSLSLKKNNNNQMMNKINNETSPLPNKKIISSKKKKL